MSDAIKENSSGTRRFVWLAIGIVTLFAAYSAGWFYIGGQLEAQTLARIEKLKASGRTAACDGQEARGYPFRIGLFCDRVAWSDPKQGLAIEAGALRSAAQIYAPGQVVSEVDGPAKLSLAGVEPLTLNWSLLHASARLSRPLPENASLEARDLTIMAAAGGPSLVTAENGQAHMRTNQGDLDLAGSLTGLKIGERLAEGRSLPVLDGVADITLSDGASWLLDRKRSLRGRSGTLRDLTVNATDEATGIGLTGPWSVDMQGRLNGQFTLLIREPAKLAAVLSGIFPEQADMISKASMALAMAASGPKGSSLPITVTDGRPAIGFFTLAPLPRLP